METQVLALDIGGRPKGWVSAEIACAFYAKQQVAWQIGPVLRVFHGGIARATGMRSTIETHAIIALPGSHQDEPGISGRTPGRDNRLLFARDRHLCAYCGEAFRATELTRDHVTPRARGGRDLWENVVSACRICNERKGCRRPEEAGMGLLYLPYRPSSSERLILENRRIIADQMEYLMAMVPKGSRLHD